MSTACQHEINSNDDINNEGTKALMSLCDSALGKFLCFCHTSVIFNAFLLRKGR